MATSAKTSSSMVSSHYNSCPCPAVRQSLIAVNEMAGRIDNLETAISDLMNNGPESPSVTPTKKL